MKISLYKKILFTSILIFVSLITIEFFLRFFVIKPWKNISIEDPSIFKPDSNLGWIAKEGSYNFLPINKRGEKFIMSFEKNGNRNIENINNNSKEEILVIGGSFTQGWGVNDNETFSYKLQNKYRNFKIYNFGQGGYGTIQTYLLLKDQITKMNSPKLVIYGIIQHHEYRNIAHAGWLRMLSEYSSRGHVKTPYGYIGKNNELLIHPPIEYLNLPFRELSSIITLIEKVYMKLNSRKRVYVKINSKKKIKQQTIVTQKAILKIKDVSKRSDAKFVVVNLDWVGSFRKDKYKDFFEKNNINFVNCALPSNKNYILLGDYHPNKKAHSFYKDCIANYISEQKLL